MKKNIPRRTICKSNVLSNSAETSRPEIQDFITLKNIELAINKGDFVAIVGQTGSGKSSILSSIIGDMLYLNDLTLYKFNKLISSISDDYEDCLKTKQIEKAKLCDQLNAIRSNQL